MEETICRIQHIDIVFSKPRGIIGKLCCIFFFLLAYTAYPQSQITFRQLSVKEGLSQNSAIAIAQDSVGFLWIATQDGLNKYDGKKFTVFPFQFTDITRPTYNHLGEIYVDRKGGVWIIPSDKIPYRLDPNTNTFIPLDGVNDARIIFQDSNLNYWIGTSNGTLYHLNPQQRIPRKILSLPEHSGSIQELVASGKDSIVVLSQRKILKIHSITHDHTPLGLKDVQGKLVQQNFSSLLIDSQYRQWIGTSGGGLYYREHNTDILQRLSSSFKGHLPNDLSILDMHLDTKNRLWLATYGDGLYMIDRNLQKIHHFKSKKQDPRALHYNDILCIYEDYLGTIWFGTDGAGASYYDENLEKFNAVINTQTPEDIHIDVVRSILVDHLKNIWIGTSGKGLTQYNPSTESWSTFSTQNSDLNSNRIMSLLQDKDNDIWIGSQGSGLSIRQPNGRFLAYSFDNNTSLSAKTIWDIFEDSAGKYWLGTQNQGLIQFDKELGEVKIYSTSTVDLLPSNTIRVITEDGHQNLWLGTDTQGILKFDQSTSTFTTYKIPGGNIQKQNAIKSLYYAENDILWIGTNGGGLIAFDSKREAFHSYTVDDGLANNVIYSILPDEDGNLWLSSNKGITKFHPSYDPKEAPIIQNYTNYDGLATEFNTGAYHKDSFGSLYFGGLTGFYWFKPEEIIENNILPKTTITDFEVLDVSHEMHKNTILQHDQNTLGFRFSSLQFSLPLKNKYQYRLVNYEKDWILAENNNYIRYTRLPPGNYEFQVKSSNYDGVWNTVPEQFQFTIKPPWYFSLSAKIGYVLLSILGCFLIYYYFKWRWKMQFNLKLKEEETVRFKKLNDFKSNLYTNIAHEFKTPLTLISGPVNHKLQEADISDSDFDNFSMVKRNTERLTSLVDQVLELAKLENGKLQLQLVKGDLGLFLHAISRSFEYQSRLKEIDYTIKIHSLDNVVYDADIIEKISTNLLSNAFKYCPEKGHCHFLVTKNATEVQIHVKNTIQEGFQPNMDRLFARFYQEDSYAEGVGVGLALVKELVDFYEGTIAVQMEEAKIINFKVTLPLYPEIPEKAIISNPSLDVSEVITNIKSVPSTDFNIEEGLPILLVVEDNAEIRSFIRSALQDKYHILEAENGKVGYEIALEKVPDIILSDIYMPVLNGIQFCKALKLDERTNHIPVILLTSNSTEESELKGLESGADAFVTKPFKIHLLEQRISNLIEMRKALRDRYSQEFLLKPKDISISPADEIFLNKVQEILDQHLTDPGFNAASFCEKMTMSRMQLHRKLIAYTGLSTSAFIRSQRLKQALQLLKKSGATINEIAYAVGFNTPSYFMKCFKETFHKTPSEYLHSNQSKS